MFLKPEDFVKQFLQYVVAPKQVSPDFILSYLNNKDIILEVMDIESRIYSYISEEFKNDREIVSNFLMLSGDNLGYASHFQDDYDMVIFAINNHPHALAHASNRLKNNKEIVLQAVRRKGWTLAYASIELQNDKAIVLEAVKTDETAIMRASPYIQELVGRNNPALFLEKYIQSEALQEKLQNDLNDIPVHKKKGKI